MVWISNYIHLKPRNLITQYNMELREFIITPVCITYCALFNTTKSVFTALTTVAICVKRLRILGLNAITSCGFLFSVIIHPCPNREETS